MDASLSLPLSLFLYLSLSLSLSLFLYFSLSLSLSFSISFSISPSPHIYLSRVMSMRDALESQNLELEAAGSRQSWHDLYKSSSWIYVGGLDYGLTEGDIEAVFSQYGKIIQLNYVKDR